MSASITPHLAKLLSQYPDIKLAILFGSLARTQGNDESDLDVAIAAEAPLSAASKLTLIEALAARFGRPIDLIDLHEVDGPILQQALCHGILVYCRDHRLYGELIRKMLYNQSDVMPYYRRILAERRRSWLES